MKLDHLTPILNVSNVPASLEWFEALGWERGFVWTDEGGMGGAGEPVFASIQSGDDAEIFLCLNGQGSRGTRSPEREFDEQTGGVWMSWFLPSREALETAYVRATELGYEISLPPTDEPWGMREFHLRHPDGHTFRVSAESG